MSTKRKRTTDSSSSVTGIHVKPLSAIAAARLKAEAAVKGICTPEITIEPVPLPSAPPPQLPESTTGKLELDEEIVPAKRSVKLCNWRHDPSDILSETESELTINLKKHTTIAFVGCFDFKVIKGAVHINGANIGTVDRHGRKDRLYRVYSPASHPILKVRGLDATNHIQFISCKEPTPLTSINPLFSSLWNVPSRAWKQRSFSIITESDADQLSRALVPEAAPEEWLRAIEDCASSPSITFIAGPSNSGKTVFAKRLLNRQLTGLGKISRPTTAVYYLDLNPSKQEYAPHGQISLVKVKELNMGPSFTHPTTASAKRNLEVTEMIRAHPIPANLSNYLEYYESCVEDLFLTFKSLYACDTSIALVVDTPGFFYTSDPDVLTKQVARFKPHNVVYMGDLRTIEVEHASRLSSLETTASQYRSMFVVIPARGPPLTPMRSVSDLETMQIHSYFHLQGDDTESNAMQTLSWTADPLSHLIPWEFCYQSTTERTQDFVGFALLSEPIESSSLIHALNGSIIQIIQSTSSAIPRPYTTLPRTGRLQLPFFAADAHTGVVEPLDPRTSTLIVTAIVRGFDPKRRIVQVLVPKIHESLLYHLSPERTVFVSGCCSIPGWAHMEDAYAIKGAMHGANPRDSRTSEAEPLWVEKKSVVEDMGYLDTVRRVRKFQT